jgi:hypothetical protein
MSAKLTIIIPTWLDKICAWPVMVYRRHKYGYDFRRISIGENEWTILDAEDYYKYCNFKWYVVGKERNFYAVRNIKAKGKQTKTVRLHREIIKPPKRRVVDHRNGDSLDNRRANLRIATRAQNCFNRRKKGNASSKYLGVHFDKRHGLWAANIKCRGKSTWLGYFKSEKEAACTHDRAAIKYHGEFARLNFPNLTAKNAEKT